MNARLLIPLVAALLGCLFILQQFRTPDTDVSQPEKIGQDSSVRAYPQDAEPGATEISRGESSANSGLLESELNHLVFPDGDIVEINWREYPSPSVRDIDIDNYEVLREAALNGDAVVSMILHQWQSNCRLRYETEEELERAIDQLYQTHTYPVPGRDQSTVRGDPKDIEQMARGLRSKYSRCKKLVIKQGNLNERWLERAASDGSSAAIIELAMRQADPEMSADLYREAWDMGNPGSLLALAEMKYRSFESGDNPSANTEAFALFLTHTVIEQVTLKKYGERGRSHALAMQNALDEKQRLLRPRELEAALEMSKQLIRQNHNCCFGP